MVHIRRIHCIRCSRYMGYTVDAEESTIAVCENCKEERRKAFENISDRNFNLDEEGGD